MFCFLKVLIPTCPCPCTWLYISITLFEIVLGWLESVHESTCVVWHHTAALVKGESARDDSANEARRPKGLSPARFARPESSATHERSGYVIDGMDRYSESEWFSVELFKSKEDNRTTGSRLLSRESLNQNTRAWPRRGELDPGHLCLCRLSWSGPASSYKPLTNRARGPHWGILARVRGSTDRAQKGSTDRAQFLWKRS